MCAAWTNSVRTYLLPRLDILPRMVRSPVDSCFGMSPSQAAKSRPYLKPLPLPIAATTALETIGPTPGMLISRWQLASCFANASISLDTLAMRSSKRRQSCTSSLMRLSILGDSASDFELKISGSALPHSDAALKQKAADLIGHAGALPHQARAHAVQCQQIHLLRRLDRDEVHGWSLHGFRDCLGVAVVVFVPFEERLHVLRRDQTHIVAERGGARAAAARGSPCAPA